MNDPRGIVKDPQPVIDRRLFLSLPLLAALPASAAPPNDVRSFLKMRHAWCPYALPSETTLEEIDSVAKRGFDAVGVSFVGPYNGGSIDFSTLDAAVDLVGRRSARAVLHIAPRFSESDSVEDTLHDGSVLAHAWNRSPNYSVCDIFDSRHRALFNDYLRRVTKRYGHDKRVAGFALGWGYMGETGFFVGDFLADFHLLGATSAGYSAHALREFNDWRSRRGLSRIDRLPVPSTERQSGPYIDFQRFRSFWVREVFQKGMVAEVRAGTRHPVGIFGYIAANPNNYARCWQSTPNADFYRSAGSASSFDIRRTLLDSGVGWEDSEMHDGKWDYSFACMRRDEARQVARSAVFHAMHVRVYDTEPQWERGIFGKVCEFLKTQRLAGNLKMEPPSVALFQPTFSVAALPSHSATQPFLPNRPHSGHLSKMMGLLESFGLPYGLVTEADLTDTRGLRDYRNVILPMWDVLERVLDRSSYDRLAQDPRVIRLPTLNRPYTRTELRAILAAAGVSVHLEFDSDRILVGRTGGLVYNWTNGPIRVSIPEAAALIELGAHEYRLVG